MKINNIKYLFNEGIRGIFLHGFMSFAAVCVTVACLLIVGSFYALTYNVSVMVEEMDTTNEILVFADLELSDAEAKSISTQLSKIENVYQAIPISREQALEDFVAEYEDKDALSGIEPSDLSFRYKVVLADTGIIAETVAQIKEIPGVSNVQAAYEMAESFSALQNVLQIASLAVIGVLLVISLLIISNTVKLAMYDRRDEIAIMKMVGATNGFIRLPFVVEGFTLGMVAAMLAFFLEWLLYDAVVSRVSAIAALQQLFSFVPFTQLMLPMIAVFLCAGMFVGVVGSWTSIRKFMDV